MMMIDVTVAGCMVSRHQQRCRMQGPHLEAIAERTNKPKDLPLSRYALGPYHGWVDVLLHSLRAFGLFGSEAARRST